MAGTLGDDMYRLAGIQPSGQAGGPEVMEFHHEADLGRVPLEGPADRVAVTEPRVIGILTRPRPTGEQQAAGPQPEQAGIHIRVGQMSVRLFIASL